MRISTTQIYSQALTSMQKQQAKLQQTELQLSSGLRILKPSDDPSGAVKVLNINSSIERIDQFGKNISLAQSNLSHEESVLGNISNVLQRVRELTIQGNNPTNHDSARDNIATELYERLDELLALGNTRDVNGEYIFAGFNVGQAPFVNSASGVSYQGDQGQRFMQIGENSQVAVRDSGDEVFMGMKGGNGTIQVLPDDGNTGSLLIGQYSQSSGFVSDTYIIAFTQANPEDPYTYTVTDSALPTPNVVATGVYEDGDTLSVAGTQINVTGTPEDGDSIVIQPSENINMFDMVKSIADALSTPAPDEASRAKLQNSMAQGLANLDQSLTNVSNFRASIGARLNNIESIESINEDYKLQLETTLSETQDLDYAEAISRFNLQLTSLEAAQQAFVKVSDLSLFRFI